MLGVTWGRTNILPKGINNVLYWDKLGLCVPVWSSVISLFSQG